jgi:hypothetical protein
MVPDDSVTTREAGATAGEHNIAATAAAHAAFLALVFMIVSSNNPAYWKYTRFSSEPTTAG